MINTIVRSKRENGRTDCLQSHWSLSLLFWMERACSAVLQLAIENQQRSLSRLQCMHFQCIDVFRHDLQFMISLSVTSDQVYDGFTIFALLEDSSRKLLSYHMGVHHEINSLKQSAFRITDSDFAANQNYTRGQHSPFF